MTVVLTIIKIIGFILLILLLVLIAAVALVLFVPVRYRIRLSSHEGVTAKAGASWLLHLVRFSLTYSGEEYSAKLYILFVPVRFGKAGAAAVERNVKKDVSQTAEEIGRDIENERPPADPENGGASPADAFLKKASKKLDADAVARSAKRVKKKAKSGGPGMFASIWGMLKNGGDMLEKGKKLLDDARNRAAIVHLKQELFDLLRKLMPKRMKVKAVYSTGSPDTTGEALGILALFPVGYKNRWNIAPDFTAEHFYIDGEADAGGRVFVCQLAGAILRILLDKNCRRLYYKIKA